MGSNPTLSARLLIPTPALPAKDPAAFRWIPALAVLLHILTNGRYGYFRDELYFMDCARHLAFGYADHAPLIALWTRIGLLFDSIAGGSLAAFRLPASLASGALLLLVAAITRELGGHSYAQRLSTLALLIAPPLLATGSLLTMNVFEPLFWMTCVLALLRLQRTENTRYWLLFGASAGLGLMNKHSTLFFCSALLAAVACTRQRRYLLDRYFYAGLALAGVLFLPNIVWQIQHNFATLELLSNVKKQHKNVDLSPPAFLLEQIVSFNPVLALLWGAGLVWLLRTPGRRWLGLAYLFTLAVFLILKGKSYYLYPVYGFLFAAGAVFWEEWGLNRRPILQTTLAGVAVLISAIAAPIVLPILPPDRLVAYMDRLHLHPSKTEVAHVGLLPQHFGDQFGWPALVQQVSTAYHALPEDERRNTNIFGNNYGEAGAINYFGPALGLPTAISGHQNYWIWGPGEKGREGTNLIVLQDTVQSLSRLCQEVRVLAAHHDTYGMAEENNPILYCHGLKVSLRDIWPQLKHWN